MKLNSLHVMYRREGDGTIFIRDRQGNRVRLTKPPLRLQGAQSSGFRWYGRLDFQNRRQSRFTRYTRPQLVMAEFARADPAQMILDSEWTVLPLGPKYGRRETRQGMRDALELLRITEGYAGGDSATNYAQWVMGNPAVVPHEWCHLVAHSMGGVDGEENVVAGAKGNNGEQLAIENILSAYRTEDLFEVRVRALRHDADRGRHLATIVWYSIRNRQQTRMLDYYLDATVEVGRLSQIHQYQSIRRIGTWMNLVVLGERVLLSAQEEREVKTIFCH